MNLIQLKPVMGEFSEVRGLQDLLTLLQTRSTTDRLALLQRLNLADIETPNDLFSIMRILTGNEREQFYALLNIDFFNRILPLIEELNSPYTIESFNRIHELGTSNGLLCLLPFIENYTLEEMRKLIEPLSDLLKKMVIATISNLLIKKLNRSLTTFDVKKPYEHLSFSKWPTDYYRPSTHWTDYGDDDHSDRCLAIISKINDALYFVPLLEKPLKPAYLDILFILLHGIIHQSTDFNYLLTHLSDDNQALLMTLIIQRGVLPQQIGVIAANEHTFNQWRKFTLFDRDSIKKQECLIQQTSLSNEQVNDIQNLINKLQKEKDSVWPLPNKDRKIEKINGLRALLIKSTQMEASYAIEQIEEEYPEIRKGISSRTAELLDRIRKEPYSQTISLGK